MMLPSYLSVILGLLSTSSGLGHNTVATGFREWITDRTARPHRRRLVLGAGVFTETAAVLMARARVAKLKAGAELARYLRAQVLVARGDDVAAPCAASMTPEIAGLGVVLTSVCEIIEARNAAEAGSGTEDAAGAGAAATGEDSSCGSGGSPVVPDGEEVGTEAFPVAASVCREEGEEKREEGREREKKGAYRGEVAGWKEGREQREEIEKGVLAPAFDDAVEGEVAQESALVAKSHVQGREVKRRCRGGDEASEDKVSLVSALILTPRQISTFPGKEQTIKDRSIPREGVNKTQLNRESYTTYLILFFGGGRLEDKSRPAAVLHYSQIMYIICSLTMLQQLLVLTQPYCLPCIHSNPNGR